MKKRGWEDGVWYGDELELERERDRYKYESSYEERTDSGFALRHSDGSWYGHEHEHGREHEHQHEREAF